MARCWSSFLKTITFLIIHRFLSLKVLLLLYLLFKKHCIQHISIWKVVLDLVKGTWHHNFMAGCGSLLWAHAAFEVGLSLDQGQGVYSGWSDVVVSSQLRLCHTCIINVMTSLRVLVWSKTKVNKYNAFKLYHFRICIFLAGWAFVVHGSPIFRVPCGYELNLVYASQTWKCMRPTTFVYAIPQSVFQYANDFDMTYHKKFQRMHFN